MIDPGFGFIPILEYWNNLISMLKFGGKIPVPLWTELFIGVTNFQMIGLDSEREESRKETLWTMSLIVMLAPMRLNRLRLLDLEASLLTLYMDPQGHREFWCWRCSYNLASCSPQSSDSQGFPRCHRVVSEFHSIKSSFPSPVGLPVRH